MRVARLMSQPAVTCNVNGSVNEAARLMCEHDCGAIPVVDVENRPVGLLSTNDLTREAARPSALGNGAQRRFVVAMGAISRPRSAQIQPIAPPIAPIEKAQPEMATAAS